MLPEAKEAAYHSVKFPEYIKFQLLQIPGNVLLCGSYIVSSQCFLPTKLANTNIQKLTLRLSAGRAHRMGWPLRW